MQKRLWLREGEKQGLRPEEQVPEEPGVTSTLPGHRIPPGKLLKELQECQALGHLLYICSTS